MARIQLLSPAQRTQLFSLSEEMSQKDIVRYYTFSSDDLAIIHEQREEHNQLGSAIQLAYHRFPGRPFQMGEPSPARRWFEDSQDFHIRQQTPRRPIRTVRDCIVDRRL